MTLLRFENDLFALDSFVYKVDLRLENYCLALGTDDRLLLLLPMVE